MKSVNDPHFERIYREYKWSEEARSERMINLIRLTAIVVLYINTLVNHYIRHVVDAHMHGQIRIVALLFFLEVGFVWWMTRSRPQIPWWFKYLSVTLDIVLLTAMLLVLGFPTYVFIVFYLIIAASALRFSMPTAIFSTLLALIAFHIVAALSGPPAGDPCAPDTTDGVIITLTMLLMTAITASATWRSRKLVINVSRSMMDYGKARDALARYVSIRVAEEILKREGETLLQGKRRDITILMSDLRGFTALSENMEPEDVVEILNFYFTSMIEIIFENNGTLDKFMGDAIMVIFGAPVKEYSHAELAVKTAVEMQAAMAGINADLRRRGLPEVAMGIGLSTGPAVVGDIGSEIRMEYTAIGRTVNLAQRLEARAGAGEILASDTVVSDLADRIETESLPPMAVKGFSDPVSAYRVTRYIPA